MLTYADELIDAGAVEVRAPCGLRARTDQRARTCAQALHRLMTTVHAAKVLLARAAARRKQKQLRTIAKLDALLMCIGVALHNLLAHLVRPPVRPFTPTPPA